MQIYMLIFMGLAWCAPLGAMGNEDQGTNKAESLPPAAPQVSTQHTHGKVNHVNAPRVDPWHRPSITQKPKNYRPNTAVVTVFEDDEEEE